jgi:hypothetical protein
MAPAYGSAQQPAPQQAPQQAPQPAPAPPQQAQAQPSAPARRTAASGEPYVDLAMYALSGVLLIVILDQVAQLARAAAGK